MMGAPRNDGAGLFTVKPQPLCFAMTYVGQATPPALGRHGGRPHVFMRGGDIRVMSVYEAVKEDRSAKIWG